MPGELEVMVSASTVREFSGSHPPGDRGLGLGLEVRSGEASGIYFSINWSARGE